MPHQCTNCGKVYEDGNEVLLKGCECGGKFFFFIKKEFLDQKSEILNLKPEEKKEIENDVKEILNLTETTEPIILDLEAIKITSPGKYELDLVKLFSGKPLIYKLSEGKYMIDLVDAFNSFKKNIKK